MNNNLTIETKICKKCKIEKNYSEFYPSASNKDKYRSNCKSCERDRSKIRMAENYKNDPQKYLKRCREYDLRNQEKVAQRHAEYFQKHREHLRQVNKIWRDNNPNKMKEMWKRTFAKNKEKIRERNRIYCRNNREKINAREREKCRTIPSEKLNNFMRSSIRYSLNGQKDGKSWRTFVDFSLKELKTHIESLFTGEMSWEKYLNGDVVIDHVLPIKLFTYENSNDPQFKACWALKNLQPLWFRDNLIKNDFLPDGRRATFLTKEDKLKYLRFLGYSF